MVQAVTEDGGGRASLRIVHVIASLKNLYNKRPSTVAEGLDMVYL